MKIGVGITTHNRPEVTKNTLVHWKLLLPKDAVLVVVDDASDIPYRGATFRFEENVGIARAKNKCLELLEDAGCDEFFLADNDCYPTSKTWWKPYVESPEAHLSYQFLDLKGANGIKLQDMKEIYRDLAHVAYTGQRGCMLYFNKIVLERVGGFDPIYGRALYEHSDLANRIHMAGLTTWRYADVVNSHKIWHSMDEYVQVNRSVPQDEQNALVKKNANLHNSRRTVGYQAWVPYRQEPVGKYDVILTSLLTKNVDPQRGYKWSPDPDLLAEWLESIERGDYTGVVLADELRKLPRGYSSSVVHVLASKMNVYYQRWLHVHNFLRDNPDVRWVWVTDGTDVEVLRDPFKDMLPSVLYVGSEATKVSDQWMRDNHPARLFQSLWKHHGQSTLLNAGVVGGHRSIVQEFAQKMVTLYSDIEAERFWKIDKSDRDVGDMAAFNKVAYESFGSRLIYGPEITTDFKSYEDNGIAKFRHK